MNCAGKGHIADAFMLCKTKGEAEAKMTEFGGDYLDWAKRLLSRMSFPRTSNQNALYYGRIKQIAEQTGETELEVRRYVKFNFGLPIIFARMPEHAEICKERLGPIDYRDKLKLMDLFQVSSLMNTKEMKRYMDQIARHYRDQGLDVIEPKEAA